MARLTRTMLAWGLPPAHVNGSAMDIAVSWLGGGVGLLLWTALAVFLTSA